MPDTNVSKTMQSLIHENLMDESSNANYSMDENETSQDLCYGRVKMFLKDENSNGTF